ncbi:MAG TPA: FeoA family protein [Methylophilus sp.]|nr:FeoA family protein [Methylophilus sp.]HQQ33965.1 FeoA family protein [Methylophilus sp.]
MRLLSQLQPGDMATIGAIHAEQQLHQRLLALGFRAGKTIEIIRRANFKGPLQVRIGATDVILRDAEASLIQISH